MKQDADRLMEQVCAGDTDLAAYELLKEFYAGYPLDRLLRLLHSKEESVAVAGAWIASELAAQVTPLVRELSSMLNHPSETVRFWVLDALLDSTTAEHGEAVAGAVMSIRDLDEGVRWKALNFLARASREQLAASLPHLRDAAVAALTTWLLTSEDTDRDEHEVVARLEDNDALTRLFAAAAAARASAQTVVPLEDAAGLTDPEVRSFATEELEEVRARRSRRSRQSR